MCDDTARKQEAARAVELSVHTDTLQHSAAHHSIVRCVQPHSRHNTANTARMQEAARDACASQYIDTLQHSAASYSKYSSTADTAANTARMQELHKTVELSVHNTYTPTRMRTQLRTYELRVRHVDEGKCLELCFRVAKKDHSRKKEQTGSEKKRTPRSLTNVKYVAWLTRRGSETDEYREKSGLYIQSKMTILNENDTMLEAKIKRLVNHYENVYIAY
jgi:hypothetical protein